MGPLVIGMIGSAIVALVWTIGGEIQAAMAKYQATHDAKQLLDSLVATQALKNRIKTETNPIEGFSGPVTAYLFVCDPKETLQACTRFGVVVFEGATIWLGHCVEGPGGKPEKSLLIPVSPDQLYNSLRAAQLWARIHGVESLARRAQYGIG